MRRTSCFTLALCAVAGAVTLAWPADAYAQRRGGGAYRGVAVPRPAVSHARPYYYGRPYYYYGRPYYYYGHPYYSSFYWGWGWGWGWGEYPYYPYYPYPGYWYWDEHASLRIQLPQREAEVFVDGYFVGLVDDFDGFSQRLHVDPGEHEIRIYLPGHRTIHEKMLFRPRVGYKIQRAMEPLAAGEPPEAKPAPTSPPPTDRRDYGRDPYAERDRVPVRARERDERFGAISIRVQPQDAIILIDGERWDRVEGQDRLVVDLAEGPHKIEVQREGHQPYSTTVQVRRGEVAMLNVSLPR